MSRAVLSDEEFRLTLRNWLSACYPNDWRQSSVRPFHRLRGEQKIHWLRTLHAGGWRAPAWPREHGGLGLTFARQRIYHEEFERQRIARVIDFGEQMLGPILMAYGTAAQQAHWLPRILSCDDVWCQGYSEPNAGSDLASLRTSAVLDGDDFLVNGQKIWTTYAQDATHMFALVRTGRFERKQQGISFLLMPLNPPGVQIRPIMNIAGEQEFCEVFLTDVRVPRQNLVGALHEGWSIAKALLGHERIWVGSPAMCRNALALARELVQAAQATQDTSVIDSLAVLAADLHDYEALYEEVCLESADASQPSARVVMLKVLATELQQRICEFIAEISLEHGGALSTTTIGALEVDIHWQLMMSRPITIFGGANEVQRDILAKSVLRLPSAR
jgi:alkylation response protein AidB-like acyl-CoA dehydrogenase